MRNIEYKYPMVVVEWLDAETSHGWEGIEESSFLPTLAYSAGFLINQTKETITIASSISDDSSNTRMTIPRKMIKSLEFVLPEGQERICSVCKISKEINHYSLHKQGNFYFDSVCKECKGKDSKYRREENKETYLFIRAKARAKRKGIDFSISIEDIKIPEKCPIFDVPFTKSGDFSPSLDRIDSTKGYIKGNIQVISTRANKIKWDSSPEEIKKLANWINKK